jgi:hypothetical protein
VARHVPLFEHVVTACEPAAVADSGSSNQDAAVGHITSSHAAPVYGAGHVHVHAGAPEHVPRNEQLFGHCVMARLG